MKILKSFHQKRKWIIWRHTKTSIPLAWIYHYRDGDLFENNFSYYFLSNVFLMLAHYYHSIISIWIKLFKKTLFVSQRNDCFILSGFTLAATGKYIALIRLSILFLSSISERLFEKFTLYARVGRISNYGDFKPPRYKL